MNDPDTPVQSPCIRNCCLDDDEICLGCFRSLEEIKAWGMASGPQRKAILHNAQRRREARSPESRGPSSTR